MILDFGGDCSRLRGVSDPALRSLILWSPKPAERGRVINTGLKRAILALVGDANDARRAEVRVPSRCNPWEVGVLGALNRGEFGWDTLRLFNGVGSMDFEAL